MRKLGLLLALLLLGLSPALAQTQTTTSAAEGSHIFCTASCNVYGGQINNTNASARWIMLFDSATVPSDGAVTGCTTASTTRPCILKWYFMAGQSTLGVSQFFTFNGASRLPVSKGLTAVCSSTGPFTKTITSDCVFSFEVGSP